MIPRFSVIVHDIGPLDSAAAGKMRLARQRILTASLVLAVAYAGKTLGQSLPSTPSEQSPPGQSLHSSAGPFVPENLPSEDPVSPRISRTADVSSVSQPLFDLRGSDIKFKLETLMDILRDSRHESWVLAAYPDPKTSRPLIGAGFNLDVRATPHMQSNPLNPHRFIEPSTAQLWQAAGLDLQQLQAILERFDRDLKAWQKKTFRKKIKAHELPPEVTDDEATRLLRISALQAIHNAKAYCVDFDRLTASQQMALSQLVYQMGVNLEQFVEFLDAMNDDPSDQDSPPARVNRKKEYEHWKTVQGTLIHSDWARRYTSRAVAVIAMFDPNYDKDPKKAESQVRAKIRPLVRHHRRKPQLHSVQARNDGGQIDKLPH